MSRIVKINVGYNIEALEKAIKGYNQLMQISNKITDTFYLEDLDTRETDPEISKKMLHIFLMHSKVIDSSLIQELFESIIVVVKEFIEDLDSFMGFLNFDENKCNFLLRPFEFQLINDRERITKLIFDEKWKFESSYHIVKRIEDLLDYFYQSKDSENHETLDRICKCIFEYGCKIRSKLSTQARNIKAKIIIYDE